MPTTPRTPNRRSTQPASRSRYGSQSSKGVSGRTIAVFATALLALVIFVAGKTWYDDRSQPIKAEFISQELIDDSTARLWIDVHRKDPEHDAYCLVYAVDYDHTEVGRRAVIVPAGGDADQRLTVEMPTRKPVASGRIYGCSQQIPGYMDTKETYLGAR